MKRVLLIITAMVMLMGQVALGCSAEIISVNFPESTTAGSPTPITATIRFRVNYKDRDWYTGYYLLPTCRFLVEAGIVPQDVPLFLLATVDPSQPLQCCPGNKNFQAEYIKVTCKWWQQGGCEEEYTITLEPLAPAEGFCDHCGGEYDNPNPSCEEDPNFYWRGEGKYLAYLGVFKGCYYDLREKGENQQQYDLKKTLITVSLPEEEEEPEEEQQPIIPIINEPINIPTNINELSQPITKNTSITWVDLIIIIIIIIATVIIVIKV